MLAFRGACELRFLVSITPLLAVMLALAGCASAPEDDIEWVEPGWMAEQVQAREQFVLDLQSCMDSKGWDLTVDEYGGSAEPFESAAEAERARDDTDECILDLGYDLTGFDEERTVDDSRARYQQELDVYHCLRHQGVVMEQEPPSEEIFVEQRLSGGTSEQMWWPYGDPGVLELGTERVAELHQVCPEPWVFAD